jgi:hypothetical protein
MQESFDLWPIHGQFACAELNNPQRVPQQPEIAEESANDAPGVNYT